MSITSMTFASAYIWLALALLAVIFANLANIRWALVFAVSALPMALLATIVELNLMLQVPVFVLVLGLGTWLYLRRLWVPLPDTATVHMPRRARSLVGVKTSLLRSVQTGKSKVQISKAIWTVRCEQTLPAGRLVEVTGWHGSELEVAPVAIPATNLS